MGFPIASTGSATEDDVVPGEDLVVTGNINYLAGDDTGDWTPLVDDDLLGYGSHFEMDANGAWTFTVGNDAVQFLNTTEALVFQYNVTSTGGNSTVTITINGLDDPPCFVRGTQIVTPNGPRPVETLREGDMIQTADAGPVAIRWIGSKRVSANEVPNFDKLQPIRIQANAFGPAVPERTLFVSPLHRMVLKGHHAQLLFGEPEVMCAAKMLINGDTISQEQTDETEYFHILFDDHHVITAEGCDTESLYPGKIGLSRFDQQAQEEVFSLFPELRSMPETYGPAARRILKRHEAEVFAKLLAPRPAVLCA